MRVRSGDAANAGAAESRLVAFYKGGRDACGRTLDQILAADDAWLEATHDFIQWVFPLPESSAFNPDAPLLTPRDIRTFHDDAVLRLRLTAMANRMLEFYGFTLIDSADAPVVTQGSHFTNRAEAWVTPGNHNFLRLSRILRSLALLGLQKLSRAILEALEGIASSVIGQAVSQTTLRYWRQAATCTYM